MADSYGSTKQKLSLLLKPRVQPHPHEWQVSRRGNLTPRSSFKHLSPSVCHLEITSIWSLLGVKTFLFFSFQQKAESVCSSGTSRHFLCHGDMFFIIIYIRLILTLFFPYVDIFKQQQQQNAGGIIFFFFFSFFFLISYSVFLYEWHINSETPPSEMIPNLKPQKGTQLFFHPWLKMLPNGPLNSSTSWGRNAAFCWNTHVVGRERTSSPIEERQKSQYFLGNSKTKCRKGIFLFLQYLAAVMLCRQVFSSLCAIFDEKKIICQIILVCFWFRSLDEADLTNGTRTAWILE